MSSSAAKAAHSRDKEASKGGDKIVVKQRGKNFGGVYLPLLDDETRLCLRPSGELDGGLITQMMKMAAPDLQRENRTASRQ